MAESFEDSTLGWKLKNIEHSLQPNKNLPIEGVPPQKGHGFMCNPSAVCAELQRVCHRNIPPHLVHLK